MATGPLDVSRLTVNRSGAFSFFAGAEEVNSFFVSLVSLEDEHEASSRQAVESARIHRIVPQYAMLRVWRLTTILPGFTIATGTRSSTTWHFRSWSGSGCRTYRGAVASWTSAAGRA